MITKLKTISLLIALTAITSLGYATEIQAETNYKVTEELLGKVAASNALRQFRCDFVGLSNDKVAKLHKLAGNMIDAVMMDNRNGTPVSAVSQNNYRLSLEMRPLTRLVLMFEEQSPEEFSHAINVQEYIAKNTMIGDACKQIEFLLSELK